MRRRSRAGGEPVKARRRKTATLKRRNARKAVHRRNSSAAVQEREVDRLRRELTSPWSSRPPRRRCCRSLAALPAMSILCLRSCWRKLYGSATPSLAASTAGTATPLASWRRIMYRPPTPRHAGFHRFVPVRSTLGVRMVATKAAIYIADAATDQDYIERRPEMVAAVELSTRNQSWVIRLPLKRRWRTFFLVQKKGSAFSFQALMKASICSCSWETAVKEAPLSDWP